MTFKATLSNGDVIKIDASSSREATLEATKFVNRLYDVHLVEVKLANIAKPVVTVNNDTNARRA